MAEKVSAGRDALGDFAPTAEEMAELLIQAAFYAGWPKASAAFRMAKDVYTS